jgi:hypothetical protein
MADERDPDLENDEIGNSNEEDIVESADDEFEEADDADDTDSADDTAEDLDS